MQSILTWAFHHLINPIFWFQPVFYAFHGWLATEMAIWLLFHPYEAKFVPGTGIQVPLTPGIMPRGRENLSRSIADTVTSTLLTESDLHQQAEKMITEANLIRCIEALLDSIEREMQNTEQVRRIYRYGEEVLPDMLTQLITGVIDNLEQNKTGKLRKSLVQLLDHGMLKLKVGYPQAEFMTDILFNTLLTPPYLRQIIVEGLTDSNINRIQRGISQQLGGIKGFIVRFIGIDQTLSKLRDFFESHPAEAEAQITSFLDRVEMRERIAERISNFAFEELPDETRAAVLDYMSTLLVETLSDNRVEISQAVSNWSGTGSRMLINRMLQINLKEWLNVKRPDLKLEIARFLYRYLHRELELMIRRILPIVNIGQMIIEKLDQFSNEQLEQIIYGICRRELRWLTYLGAFLGFWLGLVSNLIHFLLQHWFPAYA